MWGATTQCPVSPLVESEHRQSYPEPPPSHLLAKCKRIQYKGYTGGIQGVYRG